MHLRRIEVAQEEPRNADAVAVAKDRPVAKGADAAEVELRGDRSLFLRQRGSGDRREPEAFATR